MNITGNANQKVYIFYYDESEHSRKINQKTIQAGNYSNNFISVIIGYANERKNDIEQGFNNFKDKFQSRLVNNEFKSTSMKMKNGFASINKHNISFLNDFLDLIDEDILLYFSVLNKIEYVTNQIFKDYESNLLIDMDNLRYSISKSVSLYKPQNVIEAIYNDGDIVGELKKFYKERIKANNSNIILKEKENSMFNDLIVILDDCNKDFKVDWEYRISFDGFKKYLDENGIIKYQLILDKEGNENEDSKTLVSARKMNIKNVCEDDSKNHVGIQIADMLVGIISKFIKKLDDGLVYKNIKEATSKNLLPTEWFCINKDQLVLYKKMHKIITQLNNSWFKSYSGIYADNFIQFVSLLNYFDSYENFQDYREIGLEMHPERYNTLVCTNLEHYFFNMSSKLPINPITEDDGIYYNQRGAICYLDWTKHDYLEIPSTESGKVYNVLSVGFFGNMEQPNITVENNDQIECYLLPLELLNWTIYCVSLANMSMNIFPSKVKFGVINNQYYAEII
ncbi:DUF3800 domain-containing protein [Virgibacillus dokdonensis]|uniref:DUF3800 domain-containing protein n=1 Tax=Virgibacillus dokdonensis TaxID=302167 RepID=UPI00098B3657|nr:DUF3800 domain-containing protein [Virgibacillus dokdonensis]